MALESLPDSTEPKILKFGPDYLKFGIDICVFFTLQMAFLHVWGRFSQALVTLVDHSYSDLPIVDVLSHFFQIPFFPIFEENCIILCYKAAFFKKNVAQGKSDTMPLSSGSC